MSLSEAIASISHTFDTSTLEEMAEPTHKVLLDLITQCSPDPATKTSTVTALVLSLWQVAARGSSASQPSLLLVNSKAESPDPINALIAECIITPDNPATERESEGAFLGGTPDLAPQAMKNAVNQKRAWESKTQLYPPPMDWEKKFHDARITGYGPGDIDGYAKPWHPQLGLITDRRDSTILTLTSTGDKEAFRRDVLQKPARLQRPLGLGAGLNTVRKNCSVSGALALKQCDAQLVDGILGLALPYIILPHATDDVIQLPNSRALSYFGHMLKSNNPIPTSISPSLPENEWCQAYQSYLWKRLERLPLPYRHPVMSTVHQLKGVCNHIVNGIHASNPATEKELARLMCLLYGHTLRGITLSVAALAWHGLGFAPGCSIDRARKLLRHLRDAGTMSLRDIQRQVGFKSAQDRDELITRLSKEGLVVLDGKTVTAVSWSDFISSLHADSRFPLMFTVEDNNNLSEES